MINMPFWHLEEYNSSVQNTPILTSPSLSFFSSHDTYKTGLFGKQEMRILMVGLDAAGKVRNAPFHYIH